MKAEADCAVEDSWGEARKVEINEAVAIESERVAMYWLDVIADPDSYIGYDDIEARRDDLLRQRAEALAQVEVGRAQDIGEVEASVAERKNAIKQQAQADVDALIALHNS